MTSERYGLPRGFDIEEFDRDCVRWARYTSAVRARDREWRAGERAAHPKPLSTKVVHPRVLVDASPKAKKGKVGK